MTTMRSMIARALAVISILWSGLLANAAVSGCAVVQKTPDGFLYLHKAPTNSEVVTRLKQGDFLFVDTARCETAGSLSICDKGNPRRWTHVTSVRKSTKDTGRPRVVGYAISMFNGSAVKSIDGLRRFGPLLASLRGRAA